MTIPRNVVACRSYLKPFSNQGFICWERADGLLLDFRSFNPCEVPAGFNFEKRYPTAEFVAETNRLNPLCGDAEWMSWEGAA